jgi:REP element-mobilizing transposase RayT
LKPRLYEYCGGILESQKSCLIAAGGTADHIHFLVSLGREASIAETVRLVKSNTSKWMHETFPEQRTFQWQAGYGAFGVSLSSVPTVKRYVANQEERHKTRSFQEEFRAFLIRHRLAYDEKYVWD